MCEKNYEIYLIPLTNYVNSLLFIRKQASPSASVFQDLLLVSVLRLS